LGPGDFWALRRLAASRAGLKSGGYGDFEPVFRQVATDGTILYIADSGCCDGNQVVESRELSVEKSQKSLVLTQLSTFDLRLLLFSIVNQTSSIRNSSGSRLLLESWQLW
jgi:hypothetical protein